MGNEKWSKVNGIGNVDLVFRSGKKVILTNVFHVPDMSRNLASGDLLCKTSIKSFYESRELILSRNGVFVGKGYSCDRMVKLCKTRKNSNFWKKGKIVILVKTRKFSRSRMTKQILPLESSRGI